MGRTPYPQCHPVVETHQNTPDAQVHKTVLCSKDQDGLHYGEVKTP